VVAAGSALLSPTATRTLIDRYADPGAHERRQTARRPLSDLTERERESAELVATGLTNTEIGNRLGIAEATVKANVSRVLVKLDLSNRVQVALLVRDAVDPPP
jgi:DNA-binding NarL/FixJ family response regulator